MLARTCVCICVCVCVCVCACVRVYVCVHAHLAAAEEGLDVGGAHLERLGALPHAVLRPPLPRWGLAMHVDHEYVTMHVSTTDT